MLALAAALLFTVGGGSSVSEDLEYRLHVGAAATENIEVLSDQRAVAEDPAHPFVVEGATSDSVRTLLALVFDVCVESLPMFFGVCRFEVVVRHSARNPCAPGRFGR